MHKLIWTLALVGVAGWSLIVGSIYGLIEIVYFLVTGGGAVPPADTFTTGDRSVLSAILPWIAALKTVGLTVVLVVWALVSAVIIGAAFFAGRVFRPVAPTPASWHPRSATMGAQASNWSGQTIEGTVVPPSETRPQS